MHRQFEFCPWRALFYPFFGHFWLPKGFFVLKVTILITVASNLFSSSVKLILFLVFLCNEIKDEKGGGGATVLGCTFLSRLRHVEKNRRRRGDDNGTHHVWGKSELLRRLYHTVLHLVWIEGGREYRGYIKGRSESTDHVEVGMTLLLTHVKGEKLPG